MKYILSLLAICFAVQINAQLDTIQFRNSSFEDEPRKGGTPPLGIRDWMDCGMINFPNESPPDIHPKNIWNVKTKPSDGNSYLGLVVRDNESWESVSQGLELPLLVEKCYQLSIDLSRSEKYISMSKRSMKEINYGIPTVLRVWGGTTYCDKLELLCTTEVIKHKEWETYSFEFSPKSNLNAITIEAYYKTPVIIPYCGHILVDNLSDLVEIECRDD